MPNADRILERLRRLPPEMRFSELETLLTALGWEISHGKSSHLMLVSPKRSTITIALVKGRRVKRFYLRKILDEIEIE